MIEINMRELKVWSEIGRTTWWEWRFEAFRVGDLGLVFIDSRQRPSTRRTMTWN